MKWMLIAMSINLQGELDAWNAGTFDEFSDCYIYRMELAYTMTVDGSFPVGSEAVCVPYVTEDFVKRHEYLVPLPRPKKDKKDAEKG